MALKHIFLKWNYRSHPIITAYASRAFYNFQMESKADPILVNRMSKFPTLPNSNIPFLLHSVNGEQQHEYDSKSLFNTKEIECVVKLVSQLVEFDSTMKPTFTGKLLSKKREVIGEKVQEAVEAQEQVGIGVICAFRSQVLKTRQALRRDGYGFVNVGLVEDSKVKNVE